MNPSRFDAALTRRFRSMLEMQAEALARAWNARDIGAIAMLYAAEADLIDSDGSLLHGRVAILEYYRSAFQTVFSRSSYSLAIIKVRALGRRNALLHAVWSVRGQENPRHERLPVQSGLLLLVCSFRAKKCEIVLAQRTVLPPPIPSAARDASEPLDTTRAEDRIRERGLRSCD